MDFGYIFMFLGISALSNINCRNSATGMIEKIGIHSPRYPTGYVLIPNWMKKKFNVNKSKIPKYLYVELILSIIFSLLGPINIIIWIITGFSPNVAGVLVVTHASLIIIDRVYFMLMSLVWGRGQGDGL